MEFGPGKIPRTYVKEIIEENDRINILTKMGYELIDFLTWNAWLILEESSAERIIREYFIKWFTPKLVGKLRTISANGRDNVKPRLFDFLRLFRHYFESFT